ncbi:MAG TPA: hypothetical protein VM123_05725 [archaeon]|nr:hypothetical protein [archaeon]
MNDKIKMIVLGLGAVVGSFVLFMLIFWFVLQSRTGSAAGESAGQTAEGAVAAETGPEAQVSSRSKRVPGGEVLSNADVLGEDIPLEPKVEGYGWAKWGMNIDEVKGLLQQDGVKAVEEYAPENSDFASVAVLNPDQERFKVEYQFYNKNLFHVEVYYSDYYKTSSFNAFMAPLMGKYGRPYEQSATVDELGKIILHAKWDTEDSLIELVSYPNGHYALFISSQTTLIQLMDLRKTQERLNL